MASQEKQSVNPQTTKHVHPKLNEEAQEGLDHHLTSDDDEHAGSVKPSPLMNKAEAQVRENEDASLQDDTYTFDYDNTENEEGIDDFDVEDAGGGLSDFDIDNSDDFV